MIAHDSQLLDRFVREQDSTAFRNLVVRHGPAVLQVCRGVLQDAHEAEDAFQATFMVLVRKARLIQDPDSLGGWLRGVAYRTALRVRCRTARRLVVERTRPTTLYTEDVPEELSPELRQMIRAELERLPETYREPVTLCYLHGMTHQEAARKLGWPVGTVKVRLVRGRRLLRERLDRRGVSFGASLLLWLLDSTQARAVRDALLESTVRAMMLTATGRRAALESKFAFPLQLADAALATGIRLKYRWLLGALIVTGVLAGLSGPAVQAFHAPLRPEVDRAALPANLTDILNVYCE
jgi:RNA polymerase sigma factor (sigma-70 family)